MPNFSFDLQVESDSDEEEEGDVEVEEEGTSIQSPSELTVEVSSSNDIEIPELIAPTSGTQTHVTEIEVTPSLNANLDLDDLHSSTFDVSCELGEQTPQ